MPNPITPEMRAALAEVVGDAEYGLFSWHVIGETVATHLPQLRALLDALPAVKDSLTAEATTEESSAVDQSLAQSFRAVAGDLGLQSAPSWPAELMPNATPAADHSEDARAMVGERGAFDEVFHSAACQRAGLNRGWLGIGQFVWDSALAQTNSTVADVIAAAESLARKAESLSDTPEIYPALHALDLAIDAYRAGQSPGAGEVERDAARYRTVRELYWFAQEICARFGVPSEGLTLEAIDAAVDRRTEALRARARAAPMPKPADTPVVSIGAMTEEIDERTRRIREPIDRAIAEVKNGIDEAREALLLQAFKDGTHPGTVEFKWQVMQRGGIVCWLDMHYARPATPEERAEIETQLRAAVGRAKP